MERKTHHLNGKTRSELKNLLVRIGLIAQSLDDLRPSKVPVDHSFELKDDKQMYHKLRRMAPKHNFIVKKEIEKLLRARIIRPISSEWSFPVVITTKKDVKPLF